MKPICIVTGATGYIGSRLTRSLVAEGWAVHAIVRRSSDRSVLQDLGDNVCYFEYTGDIQSLISYFREVRAEVVFHLAAAVITSHQSRQVDTLIQSNILFGTQLLEAMSQSSTALFVNTGTYWQNYDSSDYNPVDLYAATKEAFEKILKYYVEASSIRAITLRLFDVYGEDDPRPKLLNRLRAIAGSEASIDVSPGEQKLDLVHVSDVCRAYLQACHLLADDPTIRNEVYGVYSGEQIRLKDLIHLLQDKIGLPIHVHIGGKPYKAREIMNPTTRYTRLLSWTPQMSLSEGLTLFSKRGGVKTANRSLNRAA